MFDGNPVKFVDDEIKAYQNNENNEELDAFYKRIKCAIGIGIGLQMQKKI